jgi:iron complex transport system substrate-binding protein
MVASRRWLLPVIVVVVAVLAGLAGFSVGTQGTRTVTLTEATPVLRTVTVPPAVTSVTVYLTEVPRTVTVEISRTTVVRKFLDALGREVEIASVPTRVVSLMPSITEILFALGLGPYVVGVTTYCNYPPEVVELVKEGRVSTVGGPWTVDLEKVLSLKPDLVLAMVSPHARLKEKFAELGLRVFFLPDARNVDDVIATIRLVAAIFGVEGRAEPVVKAIEDSVARVRSAVASAGRPRVLYLIGPPSWGLYSAGGDTFIGWLIEAAGGSNVAGVYSSWPRLSREFIVSQDPEVVIISVMEADAKAIYTDILTNLPELLETSAWRNGRVYLITGEADDMVSRPGPRIGKALELLAQLIHPEIFGEPTRADVVNLVKAVATSTQATAAETLVAT